MSVLEIVKFPNPILKQSSKAVVMVDDKIRRLMDDMIETMYKASGVGLAAVQVGVLKRILVMNVGYEIKDKKIYVGGAG